MCACVFESLTSQGGGGGKFSSLPSLKCTPGIDMYFSPFFISLYPVPLPQSGPVYQSGGDEDNPCEYSFTWETPGACPVQPAHSSSCSVRDPESGRLYDLSPVANEQNHFTVTSDGEAPAIMPYYCLNYSYY